MAFILPECEWLIQAALMEDIGRGDLTGELLIPPSQEARLVMVAREPLTICGLELAGLTFMHVDSSLHCGVAVEEGQRVSKGQPLLEVTGAARSILAAERTALNFLCRLSAVATHTARFVDAVAGTGAKILDTRKTLPGYRLLDKYAVRVGGGHNHRMRLDDGVLIKDNHIALCGGVEAAIAKAKAGTPTLTRIEVECDNLEQVREALAAGAEMILLDNMPPETLREAVWITAEQAYLEASGGVNLENVRGIAETGVHYISVGAITHSAPNVDIGLDMALS